MTLKPSGVAVLALVAGWACGYFAQAQTDLGGIMQDMMPRDSKTCTEMRYNLEMMFFDAYKSSIPQSMLKQVLPGLAEPLLPRECIRGGGHGKWLLDPSPSLLSISAHQQGSSKALEGFFTPPLSSTKDGGSQPPPPGLLGDPVKHPGGLAPSGPASVTPPLGDHRHDPFVQPFRAGFYGDRLPLGRKKRSTEEEEASAAHVRHKRANGKEEKKGASLDNFLLNYFAFPFGPSLFSSPGQLLAPKRRSSSFASRANSVDQNNYDPRPNTFYGNSPVYRQSVQAPVSMMSSPALVQAQTPVSASAVSPPMLLFPANRASSPAQSNGFIQPAGGAPPQPLGSQFLAMPMSGFSPPLAPSASVQPAAFTSPPLLQPWVVIPSQPMSHGPGGVIYGDRVPRYGASATGRRVKRASSSDVVTFGDFSIPADTFRKLINPRGSRSDDTSSDYRPPPPSRYNHVTTPPSPGARYSPGPAPPMYGAGGYPFSSPFAPARPTPPLTARRAYNLYKVRLLQARQALQQLRNAQRRRLVVPALNHVAPSSPFAQTAAAAAAAPRAAPMATLPMGAALPVYVSHPGY